MCFLGVTIRKACIKKSGKGTVNRVNDFGLPLKKYGELDRD
jgi:hypothetical protein